MGKGREIVVLAIGLCVIVVEVVIMMFTERFWSSEKNLLDREKNKN